MSSARHRNDPYLVGGGARPRFPPHSTRAVRAADRAPLQEDQRHVRGYSTSHFTLEILYILGFPAASNISDSSILSIVSVFVPSYDYVQYNKFMIFPNVLSG